MYAEGENSVAEGTHAYAESSSRSRKYLLFDHRQASESWDLTKRSDRLKALRQAYGPASGWMNLEAIADSWDDPQVSEASFRRFWLNQPVPLTEAPASILPNWAVLATAAPHGEATALGIAVDPDRVWCSIGASDGATVWLVRRERFGPWVLDWAKAQPIRPVIDKRGPASTVRDQLVDLGIAVVDFGLEDYIGACADIYDAVDQALIRHPGNDDLNAAVAAAGWRKVGDRHVFARRGGDITALEAVTLALWGATKGANYDVMSSFLPADAYRGGAS